MTNGLLGNGKDDRDYLEDNPKTNQQIPIEQVDTTADALVALYDNPGYRRWYCGIIYEFGIKQVWKWVERAGTGDEPAKLFSHYVGQARLDKRLNQ